MDSSSFPSVIIILGPKCLPFISVFCKFVFSNLRSWASGHGLVGRRALAEGYGTKVSEFVSIALQVGWRSFPFTESWVSLVEWQFCPPVRGGLVKDSFSLSLKQSNQLRYLCILIILYISSQEIKKSHLINTYFFFMKKNIGWFSRKLNCRIC